MMIVLSLVTSIRVAEPRSSILTFSSLRPSSSATTVPPVKIAISSIIAVRRSPKPGALTVQHLITPLSVLITNVANASPSRSSVMMNRGRPTLATCSSTGKISLILLIFLLYNKI